MKMDLDKFLVPCEKKVHLKHWPTHIKDFYDSEEDYQELLQDHIRRMSASVCRVPTVSSPASTAASNRRSMAASA